MVKVRFDRSQVRLRDVTRRFAAGEVIFEEGDAGCDMYIIQKGEVVISRRAGGGERRLAILEKGDFFGEMSLLEEYPERSATASAVTDVEVLQLGSSDLQGLLRSRPLVALQMMAKLSERVREANRRLEEAGGGRLEAGAAPESVRAQGLEARTVLFEPSSGRVFAVKEEGDTTIGRHDPVTGVVPDIELSAVDPRHSVSRRHATIRAQDGALTVIETNASTNGTYLNGRKLEPFTSQPLVDGDLLQVALITLRLRVLGRS